MTSPNKTKHPLQHYMNIVGSSRMMSSLDSFQAADRQLLLSAATLTLLVFPTT